MVTTQSMRRFSIECMDWAERASNPSDRQTIVTAAQSWLNIAEQIDQLVDEGRAKPFPDFRTKLNSSSIGVSCRIIAPTS